MNMFSFFTSRSLRFKILCGFLLSLLPMLAIMGISYFSAHSSTLEHSRRIMNLIVSDGAENINDFITTQKLKFTDWTQEDLFGITIEYKTTEDMQSYLKSLLHNQKGICALLLTDKNGRVLQAKLSEDVKSASAEMFQNRIIKEVAAIDKKALYSAAFVTNDFLKQLGQPSAATYLFSFKTHDSEKKHNGYLLGYLNWSSLQDKVAAINNKMHTNGFTNAQVAILNPTSGLVLAHADQEKIDNPMNMAGTLTSWLSGSNTGQVRKFKLDKDVNFTTFYSLPNPIALFENNTASENRSNLTLAAFVPENDIMAEIRKIMWTSGSVAGGGSFLIILLALLTAHHITKPLNFIISGLKEGAGQVAASSGQISSASQSLAEGAGEQASSLEETSSALEEMSSMTKQNADNANQADTLMKQANQVVERANDSMEELTESMNAISAASEETSKIIKTIDEIAFQTNLLALNAAVEAARAGEAGAGFAVVADEVRNLALRAADAANNTAELIEGTVKKTKDGTELVVKTNEAFAEVATSTAKVAELVGEIAAASSEQSRGIEQVNMAVIDMDKVTQQNAANAEQSASASQEMSSQADQMTSMVDNLVTLIGGNTGGSKRIQANEISAGIKTKNIAAETIKETGLAVARSKEIKPEQVIPFGDDDDFQDF